MAIYHDKIKLAKELTNKDYLVPNNEHEILLRVVDESLDTITVLTKWRNQYWDAFPEKFTATIDGTKKWLKEQVLENHDRILFMIFLNGEKIGHIGTYRYNVEQNSAEIDNVVRAIRDKVKGLMEQVTNFLLDWMFTELKLSKVTLKVFSDNFKAINLYERCGMLTVGMIPLERITTNDGWKWSEIKTLDKNEFADRYFSIMEVTKDSYFANK